MSQHPFDRYLQTKGHYPRARIPIGVHRTLEVSVSRGYIAISVPPRAPIYIPRGAAIKLLKWLLPLVKQMDKEFSPEDAMSEYLQHEAEHAKAMRLMKKERRQVHRLRR